MNLKNEYWGEKMLYRKAYDRLLAWKEQKQKKALCVVGARQTGKTTIIRHFGRENYENFVELNFIEDTKAGQIFEGNLDADTIVTNLTAYVRRPLEPGKTLILFDEVQECPNVRTAIKFLVEDGRFDYIESGSMLGVRYKEVRSYPVGFEEIYRMYPMDFEEYLRANGVQKETFAYLKKCFDSESPVAASVHDTLKNLFFSYIVVGGMPQVVQTYVDTHDIGRVVKSQQEILELYRLDISRYATGSDKEKIRAIFDSIPSQLNEKNRRFFLTKINNEARMNRYENSFQWLADAGVALFCPNVTEPQPPLQLNEKRNLFKLFMGDTGLLCAACMEDIQFDLLRGNVEINFGSILENMMAQQLQCNGFRLHYYDAKKFGELDFVLQDGTQVDFLEVKSGQDYKKHPTLAKILAVDNWKAKHSYVFCRGNVERCGDILYLPWYMVMFLRQDRLREGMKFEVDLSALSDIGG